MLDCQVSLAVGAWVIVPGHPRRQFDFVDVDVGVVRRVSHACPLNAFEPSRDVSSNPRTLSVCLSVKPEDSSSESAGRPNLHWAKAQDLNPTANFGHLK